MCGLAVVSVVISVCPFSRGPKESDEFMLEQNFKYTGTYVWKESKASL